MNGEIRKKGQVSIYIILVIFIIGIIVAYFLVKGQQEVGNINADVKPVYNYVENCLNKVAEDAIEHIGETGGYFEASELSNSQKIAYYFYNGENKMPSKERIEEEIEKYVDTMLFFCVKNFKELEGFEVSQGKIKSDVTIEEEKVIFKIKYPLSVKRGDKTSRFENFEEEVEVRLGVIYDVIEKFMEYQMEDKEYLCLSCVGRFAEDNGLLIDMQARESNLNFYVIDTENKINGAAYWFKFVNRYE